MIYALLSAFLFIYGQLGWSYSVICAFIWIVPLIVYSLRNTLLFKQGFLWGLIVFSFHLSWLFVMFVNHGAGWLGIFIWIFAVIWFATFCGLWFFGIRYSWIVSTILFFLFLTRWSLLPCGRLEGYPLINPMLSWVIFFPKKTMHDSGMICIQPWWFGHSNPMFVGYRMVESICKSLRKYPQAHTIILPESTFCFDLHEYEDFCPIWSDGCEKVTLLFGSHRKSGQGYLNFICMVRDGKIVKMYDKQHFMPFIEDVPWGLDLFAQKNKKAVAIYDDDIVILGEQKYQLFVCSELFFETKPTKGLPVLMLWNDAWLQFKWTKRLALRYIDYFAWKNQVPILHVSTLGITNIKNHL